MISAKRTLKVSIYNHITFALLIVINQINASLISAKVTTSHSQISMINSTYN